MACFHWRAVYLRWFDLAHGDLSKATLRHTPSLQETDRPKLNMLTTRRFVEEQLECRPQTPHTETICRKKHLESDKSSQWATMGGSRVNSEALFDSAEVLWAENSLNSTDISRAALWKWNRFLFAYRDPMSNQISAHREDSDSSVAMWPSFPQSLASCSLNSADANREKSKRTFR